MANWYVKRGSEIAGPLTQERLKELASQGRIQDTDLIRKGEAGSFVEARQIPGLLPNEDDFESISTSSQPAPKKKNTALIVILIILGGGGFLFSILLALLLPAIQQAREAARRSHSKNNLKQIGLALHNYHDTYRVFPPGGTATSEGKPYHGWGTSILPYMDHANLYNRINFDQPWSTPENQPHFQQEIQEYLNPTLDERTSPDGLGLSHYVANEKTLGTNSSLRMRHITDGTSNTILAFETGEDLKAWGDPTNFGSPGDFIGPHRKKAFFGGTQVLMGDGSVRFVSENTDPAVLEALSTPSGGERVGGF